MSKTVRISEAEWKVMEVIWEAPPGMTHDIVRKLAEEEAWKPQTIKTLLARLVKKGVLDTESQSNRYLYHPKISRDEAVAVEAKSFFDRIRKGSLESVLSHFVNSDQPLDDGDIAALRQILDREQSEKPTNKKS